MKASISSSTFQAMKPRILLSMGDYNGIGPEIIMKSFSEKPDDSSVIIAAGHEKIFEFYRKNLSIDTELNLIKNIKEAKSGALNIFNTISADDIDIQPGSLTKHAGKSSMKTIKKILNLCLDGQADAMVTAPISKEAIHLGGYNYPGHTEFLAELSGSADYLMMLVSGDLRVALTTIHVPVSEVPRLISESLILQKLRILHESLKFDFKISKPKISVLGLNPHAGDGGVIGREELDIIAPALQKANLNDIDASGPHSADSFFGSGEYKKYDAILAMYHDQGLIPFKTLSFGSGVNFTAGLPVVRTSPDHGTAYNIAGQNKADYRSFTAALELAILLAENKIRSSIIHA